MSSSSDELDKLRFKFYVDRGYFPSDSALKQLLNREEIKNTQQSNIVSPDVITNEEDEYVIFINEMEKLEGNREHSDSKSSKQNNEKQKYIKHIPKKVFSTNIIDTTIVNYDAQKEEFLSALKNYNYRSKTQDTIIIRARTFKKPDVSKAVPKQAIDLHGMTRDKAYMYIKESIEDCIANRESPILVIHGKGLHNEHGRSLVKESLDEYIVKDDKALIVYYHKAPKRLGGSGATLLYLKV